MPETAQGGGRVFDPEAERLRLAGALFDAVPTLLAGAEPAPALARFADTMVGASEHLCGACVWVNAGDLRDTRPDYLLAPTRSWTERLNDATRPLPGHRAAERALASGQPAEERIPGEKEGVFARAFGRRSGNCAVLAVPFALGGIDGDSALVLFYADRGDYFDAPMRAVIAACTAVARGDVGPQNRALDKARQPDGGRMALHETMVEDFDGARAAIVESIHVALVEDRFVLYYQPQLDARSNPPAVNGAEALIRMKGDGGEIRQPGEFIGVAEETPLIKDIGGWVLNQALTQAMQWRRGGLDLSLGVNIGARHLLSDGFVQQVREALARQPGFPPAQLEIEVTESAALADIDHARRVLAECREIGVGVAVDDFGTGHASLTYVQSLPVTRIKVDQHFVRELPTDPRNMAVIAGTVTSSGLLEIDIIAEGVETVLHGLMLIRLGCNALQGYALTPPLPEADLRNWLSGWQTPAAWRLWAGDRANAAILPLLYAEISHRRHSSGLLGQGLPPPPEGIAECALTHWLDGEGERHFSHLSALRSLQEIHVKYHRSAALLRAARSSARAGRLQMERESFARDAKELVSHLVQLQELICLQRSAASAPRH